MSAADITTYLIEARERAGTPMRRFADVDRSQADARRLLAAVEAVLALHHEADIRHRPGLAEFQLCNGCGGQWPCPTAQVVSRAVNLPWGRPVGEAMTAETLFARLMPYRFRRLHQFYAWMGAYFWLHCPLCGRNFGGHEWRRGPDEQFATIPHESQPDTGIGICPRCTNSPLGQRAASPGPTTKR